MPLQYVNRLEKTYYLHEGVTKTGKPRYYFSLKSEGKLLDNMPEGFEIYENPSGQVYCRKVPKKIITDEEVALVEQGMERFSKIEYYKIDVRQKTIRVFITNQDTDRILEIISSGSGLKEARKLLMLAIDYSPYMEFVLTDDKARLFIVRRYCFKGAVDDWTNVGEPDRLDELVKKYVRHLGEDSYYELF
ncbi:MAG: hypothetical protein WGN25_04445 [Candidatus Electrothrix sp. GW3-4]|uniref:hypothetical protein n=1 Tax=Candidatus Electrothrix sp. GW3-4 TaxID=3126740 RepID=UPI0030CEBE91